ncbi:MAG: Gfo/Idh/MocA family protein [Oceanipulchritudo sp.]
MLAKVGIVGCGKISRAYLRTLTTIGREALEVAACADLREEAARERAKEFGIPRVMTVEALLGEPEIGFIANLTIPEAHFEVSKAALDAGKHVYTEKPLALSIGEARALHALAKERGVMLSCAPDTLLGSGPQGARQLMDSGRIGTPASAFAQIFMGNTLGPHYLRRAVGSWLDMAPYHIGALVHLLGPAVRVCGLGTRPEIRHPDREPFVPEAHARAGAVLEFASGPLALVSTQSYGPFYLPRFEVFGDKGTLACPDPNQFAGEFLLDGEPIPAPEGVTPFEGDKLRGAGLIEMAQALREGRDCRLNADFSLHCAEVLLAVHTSMESGHHVPIESTCQRPDPFND